MVDGGGGGRAGAVGAGRGAGRGAGGRGASGRAARRHLPGKSSRTRVRQPPWLLPSASLLARVMAIIMLMSLTSSHRLAFALARRWRTPTRRSRTAPTSSCSCLPSPPSRSRPCARRDAAARGPAAPHGAPAASGLVNVLAACGSACAFSSGICSLTPGITSI